MQGQLINPSTPTYVFSQLCEVLCVKHTTPASHVTETQCNLVNGDGIIIVVPESTLLGDKQGNACISWLCKPRQAPEASRTPLSNDTFQAEISSFNLTMFSKTDSWSRPSAISETDKALTPSLYTAPASSHGWHTPVHAFILGDLDACET